MHNMSFIPQALKFQKKRHVSFIVSKERLLRSLRKQSRDGQPSPSVAESIRSGLFSLRPRSYRLLVPHNASCPRVMDIASKFSNTKHTVRRLRQYWLPYTSRHPEPCDTNHHTSSEFHREHYLHCFHFRWLLETTLKRGANKEEVCFLVPVRPWSLYVSSISPRLLACGFITSRFVGSTDKLSSSF